MSRKIDLDAEIDNASEIVRDAGGRIVGRTRFQKIACLLEMTGLGKGFSFTYKHYGPYSEELAFAAQIASLFGGLREEEKPTSWGGRYSIYSIDGDSELPSDSSRRRLAECASEADSVELELAVTAAFLALNGEEDPWGQTELLKAEKAREGRLARAKKLYAKFLEVGVPKPLPKIIEQAGAS